MSVLEPMNIGSFKPNFAEIGQNGKKQFDNFQNFFNRI
jgi:hypothetical protein